ncbi:type II toxin-antitoxin system RelE/ParE family toxin [Parabacteroides johnsonii]|uniref:type II toxin-antitoxin system RelE/ParE family toxin n=1 Tax=Parabacteroides johnsonii TaxID=387661 RepID=UPI0011DD39CB|nr:type II toxin-antitoxin system RelE/ParE family toxin [Parabacteroides johnsonii]
MKQERKVIAYKHYFADFMSSLSRGEASKIGYVLDMLKTQERISAKFVKPICEGLYEIRAEYGSNIFRVFFIFDNGNIVILFNGFQKKTQKTPESEINKALKIKKEYYETKGNQ